jgi:hypothetical protein
MFDTVDVAPVLLPDGAAVDEVVEAGGASVVLDEGVTLDELDELEGGADELDDDAAAVRVTATEYEVVPVPESPATVNVMFSVAPTATESVSVSVFEGRAIVPVEFVRLMAAPEDDASTVKSTDDDAFGMDSV